MWVLDNLKSMKDSDKVALIHRQRKITFKELWELSEKIAAYHNEKLVSKAPILIYGNKDIEITVVMLAALKSGRAYVCIDTTFPKERVQKIATITEAELIYNFSKEDFSDFVFEHDIKVKTRDDFGLFAAGAHVEVDESSWVSESDICYILFTSGSTGEPKGVSITKKNLVNFINGFKKYLKISGMGNALNQVSYSFDVSGIQFYYHLACGNTLFNVDNAMVTDSGELFGHLRDSEIESWVSTPSFMEMCAVYDEFNQNMLPKLSRIVLAGEILTKKLVEKLNNKFPNAKVVNGYGPSEITILTSACEISEDMLHQADNLPIGYVLEEATYWIEQQAESKDANIEEGELIVVSDSVCDGYYKQPTLTEACFFKFDGKRGYRTRDLVYKKDNLLYFKGRTDFQIKLNGYRIELEDIENNMRKIDIVSNTAVAPIYRDEKVAYIQAFVVLAERNEGSLLKTKLQIKEELKKRVPSYMIPKKITILDKLPMNSNGKADRKKLVEEYD